jgi:hypothetical protein
VPLSGSSSFVQGLLKALVMLALETLQVFLDEIEAEDAELETVRKPAEQGRFIPVLELVK